ncbi:MAG TPA: cryptochrome/photolyase family protein [Polyangiaceae bacterium]|nr:cryptochrome/photolyase family protein [Polyangiaceae bacterium]
MSAFRRALEDLSGRAASTNSRRWLFVPYDQLSDRIGPLSREPPGSLGIVLVECPAKAARRPYHKQKLALVLANLRSFAIEQASRGVRVRHLVAPAGYDSALSPLAAELGPLHMMEAAERELREELAPLIARGELVVLPHEGWLTSDSDFERASADGFAPWRMDRFYAAVRRRTGILMKKDRPLGGRMSLDAENRKSWRGQPPVPTPPRFEPDSITREVGDLIEQRYAQHPGRLELTMLPATRADAVQLLDWAMSECLPLFGPYEDAMSVRSTSLFHTRLSALINLHRLTPREVLDRALGLHLPLSSQEGFVRQILGWREFVRHVHRRTDGFRMRPTARGQQPLSAREGDPLPAAFWGEASGLACLDRVVADVWSEGYGHHITRLMILSNIATLLEASPRELTDWFWAAYVDAYDWVVEPNVLGMGTYALGDLMTTKPYVAGAAYIHRMSDYCAECAFDPKKNCPITPLYWSFLARHSDELAGNSRMLVPLSALQKRRPEQRVSDASVFATVRQALGRGEKLHPGVR